MNVFEKDSSVVDRSSENGKTKEKVGQVVWANVFEKYSSVVDRSSENGKTKEKVGQANKWENILFLLRDIFKKCF